MVNERGDTENPPILLKPFSRAGECLPLDPWPRARPSGRRSPTPLSLGVPRTVLEPPRRRGCAPGRRSWRRATCRMPCACKCGISWRCEDVPFSNATADFVPPPRCVGGKSAFVTAAEWRLETNWTILGMRNSTRSNRGQFTEIFSCFSRHLTAHPLH